MKYLFLLLATGLFTISNAQDAKKVNKCIKVYNKDKEKGIVKLRELMSKEVFASYAAYETLLEMELYFLQDNLSFVNFARENKDEIMAKTEDPISPEAYDAEIDNYETLSRERFIEVARRSTLESVSESGDVYCRVFLVDYEPDSAVSDEGKAFLQKGLEYFNNKKYELAELECIKALDADPNYYEAIIYLGETFWAREDADSALYFYERAKELHPNLLRPRKYIIDVLIAEGLFYRAKKECLDAFCIYPGFDVKMKLQSILDIENKEFADKRLLRNFYLNNIRADSQQELMGVWADYRDARDKISKYCNEDGIIEENGVTKDKYLEVYSMRYMLEKNQDELPEILEFGWKMKEEGYLEQYVFISQFHVDIYPQFEDFMKDESNRKKSIEYVEKYLIGRKSAN